MALPHELRQRLLGAGDSAIAVSSDRRAYRFCRRLAFGHYENFPVASLAFGAMRDDIAAIYAFARLADDIADEWSAPPDVKLAALDRLERWLDDPPPMHPIARALSRTIERRSLPLDPLKRLLAAFRYDAAFVPFPTEAALEAYCWNSAAPIGEMLLRMAGQWSQQTAALSDAFCAGLQVLNFWQDIATDWQRHRITAPLEWLGGDHPPSWEQLCADRALRQHLSNCYEQMSARLLGSGAGLAESLPGGRLRFQVRATCATARLVWQRCVQRGDNFAVRPRLHWWDIGRIVWAMVFG
jgi:squalene synthase HpnC